MTDKIINIEIDGKTFEARAGQMLIEITDNHDIYIPRFCYHKKLTVAANCRMCLVEVEKAPKPLPACATPVMDGMKVHTRSEKALAAQKGVMEFLLINHPLDCPICDQGGECELQDLAMGYGRDVSRYQEKKRVVKDKNIGPLVHTDLTRCIHCTRCVRFGDEIAGIRELGATGRGEDMQIGTYIEKSMVSEMSGNVIDICPVGALTSKPFRYSARTWEMVQRAGIAPHDSVGSNIHFHIKGNQVKRVVPAENESINEVWLSDRDRFSYEALFSEDRLTVPMIKQEGEWKEVDWETALQFTRDGLQKIINSIGADKIGALASPNATLEELYLFQKLVRGTGCNNIDHRVHQKDFSHQELSPVFPWLGQSITELENLDALLLVGSNVRKEQPLINHRLRKASMRGAKLSVINDIDYEFNFNVANKIVVSPLDIPFQLAGILKSLAEIKNITLDEQLKNILDRIVVSDIHAAIARQLSEGDKTALLLGNTAISYTEFSTIECLAAHIAQHSGTRFGYIAEANNTVGAALAGVLPHRKVAGSRAEKIGLDAYHMLTSELPAYLVLGLEPELDCWNARQALKAMKSADFVVSFSAFHSNTMHDYADVLLPIALFAETSGTYINCEGRAQSFNGVVSPPGEARPAWKILRVLGNLFEQSGFDYNNPDELRDEILAQMEKIKPDNGVVNKVIDNFPAKNESLQRITDIPMNSVDSLVRRAPALQHTRDCSDGKVHLNNNLAMKSGISDGDSVLVTQEDHQAEMVVIIDNRLPDDCVLIHGAHPVNSELGYWQGPVNLSRI